MRNFIVTFLSLLSIQALAQGSLFLGGSFARLEYSKKNQQFGGDFKVEYFFLGSTYSVQLDQTLFYLNSFNNSSYSTDFSIKSYLIGGDCSTCGKHIYLLSGIKYKYGNPNLIIDRKSFSNDFYPLIGFGVAINLGKGMLFAEGSWAFNPNKPYDKQAMIGYKIPLFKRMRCEKPGQ